MLFNVGQNYVLSGEYDQAIIYLNRVLEMVPDHRAAHEHIGWTAANIGLALDLVTLYTCFGNFDRGYDDVQVCSCFYAFTFRPTLQKNRSHGWRCVTH